MRMRLFVALACLGAAVACAPKSETPVPTPPSAREDMPAPRPAGVAKAITVADAGKTVEVAQGEAFAVQLVGVPTAGYLWKPARMPAFLTAGVETGGPTHSDQLKPGFAGGNHWEVFAFTATAAGRGELVFEQRRPWETTEPPVDTFKVVIVAK